MNASGIFQDLLNINTNTEDLQALQDEVKALEEEVADNKIDIANNTTAINVNSGLIITNTTNISNNGVLITNNTNNINTNTNNIITNTSAISSNTANIATNSTSIASLNNEVLKKDGSVPLDFGYTPSNNQDIATKTYVDSHSTSTAYLKVDGSNSMTGNLDIAGNSIYLDTSSNYIRSVANEIFLVAPDDIALQVGGSNSFNAGVLKNVMFKNLDMVNNNIINVGTINSISPAQITTNQTNISTNQTDIATNTNNIATNTNNITTNTNNIITNTNNIAGNTSNIATNTSNIATNTSNIATNTTDIATNTNNIALKLNKSGDTMTGDLDMGLNNISFVNDLTVNGDLSLVSASSNLKVNYMIPFTQTSGFPITIQGDHGLQTSYIESNSVVSSNLRCLSGLDMNSNNILNVSTINGISPSQISTNQNNIQNNTTNAIPLKVSKSGDTMAGTLFFNYPAIFAEFGANATNHTLSTGAIKYDVVSTTKHELVLIGAQSTQDTNNLRHVRVEGNLEVEDSLTVSDGETIVNGRNGISTGNWMHRQLYIKHPNCPSNFEYGWRMGCQVPINTSSTDMDMYFEVMRGTTSRIAAGLWDQNGSSSAINFTGQHRCMPDFKFTDDKVGLIVEATGRYMNFIEEGEECSQISCITINDSLPVVQLCNEEKSKKVFGVISNEEEKKRQYTTGAFVSFYDKVEGDNRLYINSIGEGSMYVSNKNGNLENGDYICSSGINGYGMRQATVNLTNYTVAKITMDCDFNPQLEEVKIWENGGWTYTGKYKPQYECITLDDGLKVAFVGVTYHCG